MAADEARSPRGKRAVPANRRLSVSFSSAEEFGREYRSNLANGGTFVETRSAPELRDVVEVELDLSFCGRSIALEAEVVHIVPPELAQAGGTPGVAVQFLRPAQELRELLGPLAPAAPEKAPAARRAERRADPRASARVTARVASGGEHVEMRTRDISRSGVQLAAEGAPIPVGRDVRVSLRHPTTGEELELGARVVRHVDGEGGVTALGLHFDTSSDRQHEVSDLVEAVQAAEHARSLGGIRGPVEELGLVNLLQMFAGCARVGTLTVTSRGEEGSVVFEDGRLLSARTGQARGVKALTRMLLWPEGRFAFRAAAELAGSDEPVLPLEGALLEAVQQIDETAHLREAAPASDARLDIDDAVAAAEALDKTAEAVLDLARAGFSVRAILDVIPEPDARVYAAIADLRERGVIRPAADG